MASNYYFHIRNNVNILHNKSKKKKDLKAGDYLVVTPQIIMSAREASVTKLGNSFSVKEVEDEYGIKDKPQWVHKFGEWLAHGSIEPPAKVGEVRKWGEDRHYTWLYKFLLWVESKKQRKIKVRIDPYDTWSMDDTLAHIILPMLKQLQQ